MAVVVNFRLPPAAAAAIGPGGGGGRTSRRAARSVGHGAAGGPLWCGGLADFADWPLYALVAELAARWMTL